MRQIMRSVSDRSLPIRPGDLICFHTSGTIQFVVCCSEQLTGLKSTASGTGQQVAGLNSKQRWEEFYIDWAGHNTLWSIHRTVV